jgi:hypothetical protein
VALAGGLSFWGNRAQDIEFAGRAVVVKAMSSAVFKMFSHLEEKFLNSQHESWSEPPS